VEHLKCAMKKKKLIKNGMIFSFNLYTGNSAPVSETVSNSELSTQKVFLACLVCTLTMSL
jgi:hypothetical protein